MDRILMILELLACFGAVISDESCMYIDYRGNEAQGVSQCEKYKMCQRTYKLSLINVPPFSTAGLLEKIVNKCCGNCTKIRYYKMFKNITEVSLASMNQSDFIMPFLGKASAETLYGYYFLPLVDVPSVFYFTPMHRSILVDLIINCLNLYPLIVVCLLMAVISGFIAWSLETWYNKEEFPRTFLNGLFEGFWWSFVSMTTVGYGDKTIRSIPARIFSVVWILIGIAMFGLLTALLTAEIMKAVAPHKHIFMSGANIGALKYRDYDASLIVRRGGILSESQNTNNFQSDVLKLISMLRQDEIHGFVLDKYTLAYTREYFAWKMNGNLDRFLMSGKYPTGEPYEVREKDIKFFLNNTFKTPKSYDGEKFSYGALVKDPLVYKYFRNAVRDNRLTLDTKVGSAMNQIFTKPDNVGLFNASGTIFLDTALALCGILCGICLFGILYELYTRKKLVFGNSGRKKSLPTELINEITPPNGVEMELLKAL